MKNTKNNHIKHWDTRGRTGTIQKNGYRSGQILLKRKYEHRRIMEEHIGRELTRYETVHHINHNKLDNRIENLKLMSLSEHIRMHALENGLGKDRKGIEPTNKTSKEIIKKIIKLRKDGYLLREIQKIVKLSYPTVQKYGKQ